MIHKWTFFLCYMPSNRTETIAVVPDAHPELPSKEIMTLFRCEEAALKCTPSTFEPLKKLHLKREEGVKRFLFSVAFAY